MTPKCEHQDSINGHSLITSRLIKATAHASHSKTYGLATIDQCHMWNDKQCSSYLQIKLWWSAAALL